MKKKLRLGIPKGSLQDATIALFRHSGWKISINGRSYFPEIDDEDIECSICRAQEMSRYVEAGTLDAGLTGIDWIYENDSDVKIVEDLVYSKISQRPARWYWLFRTILTSRSWKTLQGRRSPLKWSILRQSTFKIEALM